MQAVSAFSKHHNMMMDGKGKAPRILNLENPAFISRGTSLVPAFRTLVEPDSHFVTVEKSTCISGDLHHNGTLSLSCASYFGLCVMI